MNDEIKQILELHIKHQIDLLPKNQKTVLDYITNLQQLNEELIDKLDIFILSDKTKQETIDNFRKRIEKAVEYMNNTFDIRSIKDMYDIMNKLEDILNGRSDE